MPGGRSGATPECSAPPTTRRGASGPSRADSGTARSTASRFLRTLRRPTHSANGSPGSIPAGGRGTASVRVRGTPSPTGVTGRPERPSMRSASVRDDVATASAARRSGIIGAKYARSVRENHSGWSRNITSWTNVTAGTRPTGV